MGARIVPRRLGRRARNPNDRGHDDVRSFERGNVAVSAMTPTQSKQLKIGQRVAWQDSADDQGTVSASDWSGVRIEWDNGKNQFFHHNNMDAVEVARPNPA